MNGKPQRKRALNEKSSTKKDNKNGFIIKFEKTPDGEDKFAITKEGKNIRGSYCATTRFLLALSKQGSYFMRLSGVFQFQN